MANALTTDLNPLLTNSQSLILSNDDAINASLYNLLYTVKGSRRFFPNYGIGVQLWLGTAFNTISPTYYSTIISNAIIRWEPRAQALSVVVTMNSTTGIMTINISYNFVVANIILPGSFSTNVQT